MKQHPCPAMPLFLAILYQVGEIALALTPGTFTTLGASATGGFGGAATLLFDGRVLLIAGANATLFDLKTGTFTAAPRLGFSYIGQSVTLLPNNRVLVAGGLIYSGGPFQLYTTQSAIFDPSTNGFAPPQFMFFAKACPSAVLLHNGKVLIAGGSLYTEPFGAASAEVFDPISGKFTVAGPYASSPSPDGNPEDSNAGWCPNAFLRPDGRVTILWMGEGVDGVSEVFDPASNTFSALSTPSFQWLPQVPGVRLASVSCCSPARTMVSALDSACPFV